MSLIDKIKWRMIELMITKDMSRAEAIKAAAKQFGRSELAKDTTLSPKPKPATSSTSNAKEEFFARINSIRQRMFPDAKPEDDMTHALSEREAKPTGMIKRAIERIRLREDDEPAKPVEAAKPVPSNSYTEVYTGRSNSETIPDSEFPIGMRDLTTDNWRKSIEASKPRKPENEVNALDNAAVNEALERQQISFLRVVK
jgi:hypothetical protein